MRARRHHWEDFALAIALAVALSAAWVLRDWAALSTLRLPDTDDVMRLQQIRDWIDGQPFADMSQHRLGNGLAMHWSRLADLIPGGIIAALSPWTGRHVAEIAAVIAWPALLFAAALALIGSITRSLNGPATRTAIIVAAIAWPATTLFMPGRIDHHNFQIVLLLAILRALIAPATVASGAVIGTAMVASLVIGLETAPFLALAGGMVALEWLRGRDLRMRGLAIALVAGLILARAIFSNWQWDYPACDGFTATAWRAAVIGAGIPIALTLTGQFVTGNGRIVATLVAAAVAGIFLLAAAPACLSPYEAVDPHLARLWLGHVGEAQPMLAAPLATAFGYCGLMAAGIVAGMAPLLRHRAPRWLVLLAFQLAAFSLSFLELRYAYLGAILAAPALAVVIAAARRRGAGWLAASWLASAGMLYPLAAGAVIRPSASAQDAAPDCTTSPVIARLAALPPGRLIAPLDLGAYAIGGTRLTAIAAPYHRNNAGNLAAYDFFLSEPAQAARIALHWHIDYVALCPGAFAEAGPQASDPHRMAMLLQQGKAPAWLRRIGPPRALPILYRVEGGLPLPPSSH